MSEVKKIVPAYFGRFQKLVAVLSFGLFQLMLYAMILLTTYALLTMNLVILVLILTLSFLQSFATRSQRYIDFINNVIQPRRYLDNFEVIYEEQVPDQIQHKSIFGIHPHGVFSLGLISNMNFQHGPLSRMVGLASRAMLFWPIVGLILRLYGVQSVHGSHMKKLMKEGKNIGLLPGGFEEATLTTSKQLRVYIKQRKGFIKYAMEHNYTIYPILILNQHQAFWTFDYFLGFRLWLNKFKLPSVWYFSSKSLLIYPFDLNVYTVVGKGLHYRQYKPEQIPTQSEIDEVHARYIEQMKRVYAKYAHLNKNVPIVIY